MIEVHELSRTFTRYKYDPGLKGTLKNLFKRQAEIIHAVKDISFSINQGEFVGYIGPNGAGKSTTIKILAGILTPTSGTVQVNHINPTSNRKLHAMSIGAVFGQRSQLWWDLPIADSYTLFKHMYRLDNKVYEYRLGMIKEVLGLNDFWDTPVRQLSLGQRMRGELGGALLHGPTVLFLDEPTIGMDVLVKEQIKFFLKRINQEQKVSILLTTHDLKDVEDLCSRVLLINKGQLIFDGPLENMRQASQALTQMEVEFEDSIEEKTFPQVPGITLLSIKDRRLSIGFLRREYSPVSIMQLLSTLGVIRDVKIVEPSIEEVIKEFYI